MLVVLVVIMLLAAIVLPALFSCRESARQAVCMSHIKQLLLAFQMYADDYARLPGAGDFQTASPTGWIFSQQEGIIDVRYGSLFPFTHSSAIYHCPSAPANQPLSYTMNFDLSQAFPDAFDTSKIVLLIEEDTNGFLLHGPNDGSFHADHMVDRLSTVHHSGGLIGWLDGHIKWVDPSRRWDITFFGSSKE